MRTRTCARVGGGTANLPQCPGQPILGSGMGARARVPAGLRRSPLRRPGTFCAPLLHCPEAAVLFPAASSLRRVALRTHMYMHMHVDMQMQMHIHRHVHIHMHVDMHIYIEHVRAHSTYTSCVRVCTYSIHAPTHPPSCTHMQLLPTPAAAVWPWNQGAGTHSQKCSRALHSKCTRAMTCQNFRSRRDTGTTDTARAAGGRLARARGASRLCGGGFLASPPRRRVDFSCPL
jgi:hypothetical protein